MEKECIFCKIVAGESTAHVVWEDVKHLAFLTIYPNTEGVTVVIPKAHTPSYIFENDNETISRLILAAKTVALKIDTAFEDVGRTGVIFEGFGIDHLHAKLYPMHGTGHLSEWQQIESKSKKDYFKEYPGYLSSHDSEREDDEKLRKLAEKIKNAKI